MGAIGPVSSHLAIGDAGARRGAVLASLPAASQRGGGAADDEDSVSESRDCINLSALDRTRVADERTILFYMRGGDLYRNDLPNRCPNLDFEERFMYRVTANRLCNLDVITVIDDVGFGFIPGASCGLGTFRAISEDEASACCPIAVADANRN